MKPPITSAQAMSHTAVIETINALGKIADELRAELDALKLDALRFEWVLEVVIGDDTDSSNTKTMCLAMQLMKGLAGRVAIDAAMKEGVK